MWFQVKYIPESDNVEYFRQVRAISSKDACTQVRELLKPETVKTISARLIYPDTPDGLPGEWIEG